MKIGQPVAIRPLNGAIVKKPSGAILSSGGEIVTGSVYWQRRVRDGSVEEIDASAVRRPPIGKRPLTIYGALEDRPPAAEFGKGVAEITADGYYIFCVSNAVSWYSEGFSEQLADRSAAADLGAGTWWVPGDGRFASVDGNWLSIGNIEDVAGSIANVDTVAANIAALNSLANALVNGGLQIDIYLGAQSSNPSTRTNGSSLQDGDIYFNTSTNRMKGYANGVWYSTETAGATDAAMVSFLPSGTGVVPTTAQSKLREFDSHVGLVNEFGLLAAHDAFRKLDDGSSTPAYVGITSYGDSMAAGYMTQILIWALQNRYGVGGVCTPNLGISWSGAAWTFAGGATNTVSDRSYLPGGNQIQMPAGSTANITTGTLSLSSTIRNDGKYPPEFDHRDGSNNGLSRFKSVRCFYITRPGDGSLSFTLSQAGIAGYSPVVANCNAALGLSYVDINVLDAAQAVSLSVAASTATCLFVGAVFLRESGVLHWTSAIGGTTMTQIRGYIDNGNDALIYKPLAQALSTALVIHTQRIPGDANWQANYVDVFNSLDAIPAISQFVLGEPPRLPEDTPSVPVINNYLLSQCLSRGYAFYDLYRAVGSSNAVLTTLGWGDGDGIHLDPPIHRYFVGKILKEVDWFRVGGNRLDIDVLTMPSLLKRLCKLQALTDLRSSTISGRGGATIDGTSASGGYTYAADNSSGFTFNSAAALGYVAGRPGSIITNATNINTPATDVYSAFVGFRNLSLPTGVRAFVLLGVTSTFTSLSALNQRCYGFECAKGSDVGSPLGVTGEVVRLLHCDGVTTTYGPWVSAVPSGAAQSSQSGLNIVVGWNKSLNLLELWRSSASSTELISTVAASYLNTNGTAGASLNIAIVGENAGNVPVAVGRISFTEIKTTFNTPIYGVAQNNLMGS